MRECRDCHDEFEHGYEHKKRYGGVNFYCDRCHERRVFHSTNLSRYMDEEELTSHYSRVNQMRRLSESSWEDPEEDDS